MRYGNGCGQTGCSTVAAPPYIGLARPKNALDWICSYGIAQAIACRSFTLSNGGREVLSATYQSAFGIGTPTTLSLPSLII